LVDVGETHAVAEVVVAADGLFVRDGRVPGWVGIEYMAQTIAAWSGARHRREGNAPRLGMLLGTRRYDAHGIDFAVGDVARVEVHQEFVGANGLGVFDCRILVGGAAVASARLNIYEPGHNADFLRDGTSHE
jgi:predicted hotdog family 3-hydroxylacyl-ACP dehydratase